MRKKRMTTGLLAGLLLAMLLAGCGAKEQTVPTQDTLPPEIQIEQQTEAAETEDLPYVTVATPYGNLYFQDQWEELMQTEQTQEGESIVVTFFCQVNDIPYTLFYLSIGPGAGTPVGVLTDDQGIQREVFAGMEELEDIPELSDSEKNRLYAMQEDINYIIENLK